jgi:excisionase family DNA binding protein
MNDHLRAIVVVPKKRLFTFSEALDYLGFSEHTLNDLIDDNEIPCYRLGCRKKFKLEELDRFIDELPVYSRNQLAAV